MKSLPIADCRLPIGVQGKVATAIERGLVGKLKSAISN